MCGIAGSTGAVEGIGGAEGPETARHQAARMLVRLRHRGPEASAVRRVGSAALAACELAFCDPGTPHQPMLSEDGQVGLVFNGEIYNGDELRRRLGLAAWPLRTRTDTELILRLYQKEGLAFAERLRGMYAIALHDARTRRTVLLRDPLGKKPLYWFRTPGGVVFASELKGLLAHPLCPREVDPHAVLSFFLFNAVPSPATPFRGVWKLRPGTMLVERRGHIEERQVWSPARRPALGEAEAREALGPALRQAVARRMRSTPLPLGVLLSGGIDSSLVAALAAESSSPLQTFTAGFAEASYDESAEAAEVARHLGARHHTVRLDGPELLRIVAEDLPRIDEPLADPSLLPTLAVCRLARSEVKGVLSGDGADEWLYGYSFFRFEKLLASLEPVLPRSTPRLLQSLARRLPVRHSNLHASLVLGLLARGLGVAPERRFYECTSAISSRELPAALRPEMRGLLDGFAPYGEIDRLLAGQPELGRLERCRLGMVRHFLQDVILAKVDRASMSQSLEVRSPFLDLDVVEIALALPPAVRLRGAAKPLLRELGAPLLPASSRSRRKRGFRAPVARLLCEELRPLVTDLLGSPSLAVGEYLDAAAIRRRLGEHLRREADHQKLLWAVLCFETWHRSWVRREASCEELPADGLRQEVAG